MADIGYSTEGNSQQRSVLKLSDKIAPYRAAVSGEKGASHTIVFDGCLRQVLPVVKKPELIAFAKDVFETIAEGGPVDFDVTGSIGMLGCM